MLGFNENKRRSPVTWVITAVILAVVALSMIYTMVSEPGAAVDGSNLKIDTMMYGMTQPLNEIKEIKLSEEAPEVTYKSNGVGLGSIDRGWFDVKNMGNGRLYVHMDAKPFIYITTRGSFIIINYKDPARTQKLYDELMKNWK